MIQRRLPDPMDIRHHLGDSPFLGANLPVICVEVRTAGGVMIGQLRGRDTLPRLLGF